MGSEFLAQNRFQNRAQNRFQNRAQNRVQNRAQNRVQNRAQNRTQNRAQNRVQNGAQKGKIDIRTWVLLRPFWTQNQTRNGREMAIRPTKKADF